MKVSEMIRHLEKWQAELGDVEVLVTDGFNAECYRGDYAIEPWQDDDGLWCVDIGIGGCKEEDYDSRCSLCGEDGGTRCGLPDCKY